MHVTDNSYLCNGYAMACYVHDQSQVEPVRDSFTIGRKQRGCLIYKKVLLHSNKNGIRSWKNKTIYRRFTMNTN
uniref:Uncharacterized protein n=1 Tax=Pararge aegeria TaxID=116150 RepID=S4P9F5_9NEOP